MKPGTNAFLLDYPIGLQLANTCKVLKVKIYESQINKEYDEAQGCNFGIVAKHAMSLIE